MSRLVSSFAIRIAIVAVIAAGAFILRDRGSGAVDTLAVGDCFDQPTTAVSEVEQVQRRPCSDAHTAEVFHEFDHPAAADDAYPTAVGWDQAIYPVCDPEFTRYTGLSVDALAEIGYTTFTPTREGWQLGDREVTCFLARTDGEPMSRSQRVATP